MRWLRRLGIALGILACLMVTAWIWLGIEIAAGLVRLVEIIAYAN